MEFTKNSLEVRDMKRKNSTFEKCGAAGVSEEQRVR